MKLKFILFTLMTATVIYMKSGMVSATEAPYYMWTDEDGVLNFSQLKPNNTTAEYIVDTPRFGYPDKPDDPAPDTVATDPEATTEMAEETEQEQELPSIFTPDGEITTESVRRVNAAIREENCKSANRVMDKLTAFKQIIVHDDNDVWREISEEEKQLEIEKTKSAIAEFCDPVSG